jgi:hypothetical protein
MGIRGYEVLLCAEIALKITSVKHRLTQRSHVNLSPSGAFILPANNGERCFGGGQPYGLAAAPQHTTASHSDTLCINLV